MLLLGTNPYLFFLNQSDYQALQSTSNALVPHPVFNPLYRISAPTTPAPMPPVHFAQNPGYFLPPPPPPPVGVNSIKNEQEELDSGFFNLFDSTFNKASIQETPNSSAVATAAKPNPLQPTVIPHRYNQSYFNTSSQPAKHSKTIQAPTGNKER